jgi:hypothetical protein
MKPISRDSTFNFSVSRFMKRLANFSTGRVALHVLCLFRHPGHSRWHWRGIVREFAH